MYKMTKEELRRAKKLDLKTAQAGWTTLDVLEWLEKNMEIEDYLLLVKLHEVSLSKLPVLISRSNRKREASSQKINERLKKLEGPRV